MSSIYYGESMYGGYYLEWVDEAGERLYFRFEKISELKRFSKAHGINLKDACRFDN